MIEIMNTSEAIKKGIEIGIRYERQRLSERQQSSEQQDSNITPKINELKIAVLRGLEPLDICKRLDELKNNIEYN
jgi:hypothetical protein